MYTKSVLITFCLLFSSIIFAQKQDYKIMTIAFYNLENLFDTINTPGVYDEEFTPDGSKSWTGKNYWDKQTNLAKVLSELGTDLNPAGPAIIGVAEIENRSVLEDLAAMPAIADRQYQVVHYDSPDRRGVDVAMFYNPRLYRLLESRALPVNIKNLDGRPLITRDILYTKGILDGDTIHVMVNHWPSRRGGEAASRPLRSGCAAIARAVSDSIRLQNPHAKIIVMGDLNDDPNNESVFKVLEAKPDIKKVKEDQFYNPFYKFYKKGMGSNAYQDAWSLFDQIMVSYGFVDKNVGGYQFYTATIYNPPYMQQKSGRYKGYPFRTFDGDTYISGYSDHYPTFIHIVKPRK